MTAPNSQIAITATTFYPKWYPGELKDSANTDKIRGDLALVTIKKAKENGYSIVISDKSPDNFSKQLENLKITVLRDEDDLSFSRAAGRRAVIKNASQNSDVKVIVRMEPEKVDLLNFIDEITKPILNGNADIVLPSREANLFFKTYPPYMWESEMIANLKYNQLLYGSGLLSRDIYLDFFFGPTVIKNTPDIINLFMEEYKIKDGIDKNTKIWTNPEEWSDAQLFPLVKALFLNKKDAFKYKIKNVEIPFKYPNIQKDNETDPKVEKEFIEKRTAQRLGLLTELIGFIRFLKNDSKSILEEVN